jgi:hypothetical protein
MVAYNRRVQRLFALTLAVLAIALMGARCEYAASVNNPVSRDPEAEGSRTDGAGDGLVIVVTSGDLDERRVAAVGTRASARSSASPAVVEMQIAETDEALDANPVAAAVPLLTPWGVVVFIAALSFAGYLALRRRG